MPAKELVEETLEAEGQFCTIGAVMHSRGLPISNGQMRDADPEEIALALGSTHALVAEIIYHNDDYYWPQETPAGRWKRMRSWILSQIKEPS